MNLKEIISKQKEFISKNAELLKEEKFEEVVKSFEENSELLKSIETEIEEEEKEEKAKEEAKEEIEKKLADEEEEKEAQRIKKYAEIFANADTMQDLLAQLKDAQEELKKMSEKVEKLEKSSRGSMQPEEDIKKSETDAMGEGFDNIF